MKEVNGLIAQVSNLHTTKLGIDRIQKNLGLEEDVVEYCKKKVLDQNSIIYQRGKNWYVETQTEILTINAHSFTIITAHKKEKS